MSLFLLKSKIIFKKVWYFFKTYWYVPLLISWAVIAWLIFRKSSADITGVLWAAEKSYRDHIDVLNEAHGNEIKKRDEAIERYEKTIKQLEEERKRKNEVLTAKEKKRVKELAEKHKDDPEAYAREIADKFGFEYVENE